MVWITSRRWAVIGSRLRLAWSLAWMAALCLPMSAVALLMVWHYSRAGRRPGLHRQRPERTGYVPRSWLDCE